MATWHVTNLERNADEPNKDGVTSVEFQCSQEDGDYSGIFCSVIEFTPDSTKDSYVSFSDLTEEIVLSWIFNANMDMDKDAIEADVASQIAKSKETVEGLPWS